MKTKIIAILLTVAFALTSTPLYAARTNTVTGQGEGMDWARFQDVLQKSTTAKDTFLAGLGGVRHAQVSITAANIIAMYTTPVVLVAAPGAGKSIAVTKLQFKITRTATAFTGGGAVIVQYDSTANGAGTQALDSTLASTVVTGAAGTSYSWRNGAVVSDSTATVVNKGLYLSNDTAVFAAGTGTATVDIWYVVNP